MHHYGRAFAGLEFKWDSQYFLTFVVNNCSLNSGINHSLQAKHWGPNMLFDIEKFGNGNYWIVSCAMLSDGSICL